MGAFPLNSGDFVHDLPYAHRTSKPNGVAACDGGHCLAATPSAQKSATCRRRPSRSSTSSLAISPLRRFAASSPTSLPNEIEGWDRARRKVQWTIRTFVGRTPTSKETCRGRRRQDGRSLHDPVVAFVNIVDGPPGGPACRAPPAPTAVRPIVRPGCRAMPHKHPSAMHPAVAHRKALGRQCSARSGPSDQCILANERAGFCAE